MNIGTLLVIIIGAVGLIAVLWLRTSSHRVALRNRATMMDLRAPGTVDDDTREQALLLLDRNEKIAAIKLVHEHGGLGLREARDFVAHIEATTTFEPNDPNAPTSLSSSEWRTDDHRPAHEGHDWRSDDSPAHSSSDWSSSDSGSHSSSDWSSSDSGSSDSDSSSSSD